MENLTAHSGYDSKSAGLPKSGSSVAVATMAEIAVSAVALAGYELGTPEAVRVVAVAS